MSALPSQASCRITLPNDPSYLPPALSFVQRLSAQFGFNEADCRRIELAVEEAATNVIEHAFRPAEEASFDLVCRKTSTGMEILIHDTGIPWDPTLDEAYHPEMDLANQSGKGLGRHLIQHLMDEYSFENLGRDGKQVKLVKHLHGPHITEGVSVGHSGMGPTPQMEFTVPAPILYRRMAAKEAIEVARVVFDCYGYSYAGEFMYYPERIAAMNADGTLLSAVAVDERSGEIAGHAALLFNDDLPAELAVVATKPKFRGLNVARGLGDFLNTQAERLGLPGIYVKEVTVHPFTQRFCQKLGFHECGFLLAHSPKSLTFKGIANDSQQRNSNLLAYKGFGSPKPRTLYPPPRHREMIEQLYAALGIPVTVCNDTHAPDATQITAMRASVNSGRALCEIHFDHYGTDIITALRHELHRARRHEVQLVEMYLSLADPCTPWVATEAEKLGFFFTGILPNTRRGDALILQLFNGIAVDYEALSIANDQARELLAYVMTQDPTLP